MIQCPKCLTSNPEGSRFCNSCAEALTLPSQIPSMDALGVPRPGLAIASLVFGIVACGLSLFVVGALFGLTGLVLGLLHLFRRRRPNGMAWWGIGLSIFAILVSVAIGFFIFQFFTAQRKNLATANNSFNQWIGAEAPDFTVTTLDGKPVRLSELRGKRVVLDFWATWCGPCVAEMPHFEKLYSESSRDELSIVGISNEDESAVRSFVAKQGIKYPIAVSRSLPSPYKDVTAIPTTFFIDRKGIMQSVFVGSRGFNEIKDKALTKDYEGLAKISPEEFPKMPNQAELAGSSRSADPWMGVWRLNPAKSKMPTPLAADIAEALVTCRELDPYTVEITSTQIRKDGSKVVGWRCTVSKSGGMQNYQKGAPEGGVTVLKTVVDDHTQYLAYLQNGTQFALATIALGRDGKTYTLSSKSEDASGQPMEQVEVYEKQ